MAVVKGVLDLEDDDGGRLDGLVLVEGAVHVVVDRLRHLSGGALLRKGGWGLRNGD